MADTEKTHPEFVAEMNHESDSSFALHPELLAAIFAAIERQDVVETHKLVAPLPAPDQAELYEQLNHDERVWLTEALAADFDSDTLAELSPEAAEDVIEALGTEKSVEVLAELETDDAVHILEDLSAPAEQLELLEGMPHQLREDIEESLTYAQESAGRSDAQNACRRAGILDGGRHDRLHARRRGTAGIFLHHLHRKRQFRADRAASCWAASSVINAMCCSRTDPPDESLCSKHRYGPGGSRLPLPQIRAGRSAGH